MEWEAELRGFLDKCHLLAQRDTCPRLPVLSLSAYITNGLEGSVAIASSLVTSPFVISLKESKPPKTKEKTSMQMIQTDSDLV